MHVYPAARFLEDMQFVTRHRFGLMQALLCLLFVGRIVAGYSINSATYDENGHISRGIQWLETGGYQDDGFQMPLPRLLCSTLPHWAGYTPEGSWLYNDWTNQTPDDYWRSLTLARVGNLPFVIALFAGVAAFSRRLFGDEASLAASAALACCPNVIGHAGLATLDIGGTAGVLLTLYVLWCWRLRPRASRACLAGAAYGVAQVSKFSAPGFLVVPLVFAVLRGWRGQRLSWKRVGLHGLCFVLVACFVIWAGYGFDSGEVFSHRHNNAPAEGKNSLAIGDWLQGAHLPAPMFWRGFVDMAYLQQDGFPAFFLGEMGHDGWWYYFPAALLLKATPPLLLLAVLGFVCLWKQGGETRESGVFLAATFVGILVVSTPSRVTIGVRHVLPLFPLLCLLAAGAFVRRRSVAGSARGDLATPESPPGARSARSWMSIAAGVLLAWHAVESLAAHPDYLAYFNPAFRQHDYHYLSDSNLDWGQDRARLAEWIEDNRDKDLHAVAMQTGDIFNLHERPQGAMESSEWIVISTNQWAIIEFGPDQREQTRALFRKEPWGRIGRSMLIYHFPERAKDGTVTGDRDSPR
ncbi:MAG: glycosyltransferase family 39 protein [Bryobacterales bacterium]